MVHPCFSDGSPPSRRAFAPGFVTASPSRSFAAPRRLDLSDTELLHRLSGLAPVLRRDAWAFAVALDAHQREAGDLSGSDLAPAYSRPAQIGASAGLAAGKASDVAGLLRRVGALRPGRGLALAQAVQQPTIGARLDWPGLLRLLDGETAALLVCRTFALLIDGLPGAWVAVEIGDVARQSTYSVATARRARTGLEERGILQSRPMSGAATEYRFAPLAWGERESASPENQIGGSAPPASTAAVQETPAEGVVIEVRGVEVEVAPGAGRVRIEPDGSGGQVVRVGDVVLRSR